MALIDYVDLPTMKLYVGLDSHSKYDVPLQEAITASSRDIDNRTERYFGRDAAPSDRQFIAGNGILFTDDISSATPIVVTSSSGAVVTDYISYPFNGIVSGQPGWPTTRLKSRSFCRGEIYTVNATWGWDAVPDVVHEVCKILSQETFLTKDTPHGVKGIDEFGVVRIRESRQIGEKLRPVMRHPVSIR